MLPADYAFGLALAVVVAFNLYFGPRVERERVAMQWGAKRRANMVRSKMAGDVGNARFHVGCTALYLARFDLCAATCARR